MNLNLVSTTDKNKNFFWNNYCDSMLSHIEQIWGWDEKWQKSDFKTNVSEKGYKHLLLGS